MPLQEIKIESTLLFIHVVTNKGVHLHSMWRDVTLALVQRWRMCQVAHLLPQEEVVQKGRQPTTGGFTWGPQSHQLRCTRPAHTPLPRLVDSKAKGTDPMLGQVVVMVCAGVWWRRVCRVPAPKHVPTPRAAVVTDQKYFFATLIEPILIDSVAVSLVLCILIDFVTTKLILIEFTHKRLCRC